MSRPALLEEQTAMTSGEVGRADRDALWNFIRSVAGRNNIPAEEVERDIEKAIKAVREERDGVTYKSLVLGPKASQAMIRVTKRNE